MILPIVRRSKPFEAAVGPVEKAQPGRSTPDPTKPVIVQPLRNEALQQTRIAQILRIPR